jgi:hypothetical protein
MSNELWGCSCRNQQVQATRQKNVLSLCTLLACAGIKAGRCPPTSNLCVVAASGPLPGLSASPETPGSPRSALQHF